MKNVLLFMLAFFTIPSLFAAGNENIEKLNIPTSGSHIGSYTGDMNTLWNYKGTHSSIAAYTIAGTRSIVFASSGARELVGESGIDGVGDLSFSIRSYFNGGTAADRSVEVFVAGVSRGTFTLAAMNVVENYMITDIVEEGNVEIKFVATGTQRLVLDNISWTSPPTLLPVTMTSFSARQSDVTIELNWQTVTEENNEYFSIEHSTDGRNYEEIGQVNGAGTTTDRQDYAFTHKNPSEGIHYYRLQQFDFNGASTYSSVVVVSIKSDQPIKVFPTQAFEQITISFAEATKKEMLVSVYDIMGRMVLSKSLDGETIENNLSVFSLEKGHYFLQVENGSETYIQRFIKMN